MELPINVYAINSVIAIFASPAGKPDNAFTPGMNRQSRTAIAPCLR